MQSFFSGDPQFLIFGGTVGEYDGIVVWFEGSEREIMSEVDITDKIEARGLSHLCELIFTILVSIEP